MFNQNSSSQCTSSEFEKSAISRFYSLVNFLPKGCKVFREPWGNSTILCLDFEDCPSSIEIVKEKTPLLIDAILELGLTESSIIFRIGNKLKGWRRISTKSS